MEFCAVKNFLKGISFIKILAQQNSCTIYAGVQEWEGSHSSEKLIFRFKIELFPRMLCSLRICITAECEETCHFVEDNEHSFELRLRGVLEVVDVVGDDLTVGDQVALAVDHVGDHHDLKVDEQRMRIKRVENSRDIFKECSRSF